MRTIFVHHHWPPFLRPQTGNRFVIFSGFGPAFFMKYGILIILHHVVILQCYITWEVIK